MVYVVNPELTEKKNAELDTNKICEIKLTRRAQGFEQTYIYIVLDRTSYILYIYSNSNNHICIVLVRTSYIFIYISQHKRFKGEEKA